MLMSRPRTETSVADEMTNIHNYYERLVNEAIMNTHQRARNDADFLADVSCVALNHLPPRYIRHDVDMSFFMSPVELQEISSKVQKAVDNAITFVMDHEREKLSLSEPDDDINESKDENKYDNKIAPPDTAATDTGKDATH